MKGNKIKCFFVWMRNGISFCFTWLMILLMVWNSVFGIKMVSTIALGKLLLFVSGGVLLFTIIFSNVIVQKLQFTVRLTSFMIVFAVYESICFYWMGVFPDNGSIQQWLIFIAIILLLYFISIGIYQIYSREKGVLYTQALQRYQSGESE